MDSYQFDNLMAVSKTFEEMRDEMSQLTNLINSAGLYAKPVPYLARTVNIKTQSHRYQGHIHLPQGFYQRLAIEFSTPVDRIQIADLPLHSVLWEESGKWSCSITHDSKEQGFYLAIPENHYVTWIWDKPQRESDEQEEPQEWVEVRITGMIVEWAKPRANDLTHWRG